MAKFNTTITIFRAVMVGAVLLVFLTGEPGNSQVKPTQSVVVSENDRKPVKDPGGMRGQIGMREDFDAPLALSEIKI